MDYSYVNELMSGYVWYKKLKDVSLSDAIRQEFEKYYKKITGYKGSFNDSIKQELTNLAENIKQQVRNELLSAGIKKGIYVKEYIEFLFKACLLLMGKFGVEQNKATAILGMPRSAYYKLDIYPLRCYDAYMGMVDEDNRYALKPNDKDSDGIQIIRCINREIQSKYACSTAKISDYVDRISRSPKNERYLLLKSVDFKLFGKQKMGEDDEVEGFDEINLEELCSLPDKQLRPILLYIDAEAYPNVFDVIQDIKCLSNIIFVLHTKEVIGEML